MPTDNSASIYLNSQKVRFFNTVVFSGDFAFWPNASPVFFVKFVAGLATKCPVKETFFVTKRWVQLDKKTGAHIPILDTIMDILYRQPDLSADSRNTFVLCTEGAHAFLFLPKLGYLLAPAHSNSWMEVHVVVGCSFASFSFGPCVCSLSLLRRAHALHLGIDVSR